MFAPNKISMSRGTLNLGSANAKLCGCFTKFSLNFTVGIFCVIVGTIKNVNSV